jgi:cell division protein FtsI/penicillin-binding protein 2
VLIGGDPVAPPEVFLEPPVTVDQWLSDATTRTRPGPPGPRNVPGPLEVEYTFSPDLMARAFSLLERSRVSLGHIVVLDPNSGQLLAYASTDTENFPPQHLYPAASLVKVVTTEAALRHAPEAADAPCRFVGSPYRLTRSRVDPPSRGRESSLLRALAISNNQCFAQLAVHHLGTDRLLESFARFGLLESPAPGHPAGLASDPGEDALALGRLGSGLDGLRITPLHAARMAAMLSHGRLVTPRWVSRVSDALGRDLALPVFPDREALSPETTERLRMMLVETTRRGTASRAFRTRRGRPLLQDVSVAGKTGSLSGDEPKGRYEWFIGVAPAEAPRVAVAVLVVQGELYWATSSQVAAELLKELVCPKGVCAPDAVQRFLPTSQRAGEPAGGDRVAPATQAAGQPAETRAG